MALICKRQALGRPTLASASSFLFMLFLHRH